MKLNVEQPTSNVQLRTTRCRETLPLADVIRKVLTGSGQCATIDWTLLGLSMPAWVLIAIVGLALWAALAAFRRR